MFFLNCATIKDPSFKEILDNAQHDIKVDSIKSFTSGLPFIPPVRVNNLDDIKRYNEFINKNEKVNTIFSKYGLYKYNLGCVIDNQTKILSKKYNKATKDYLLQRNGKNWEQKMKKQIDSIINK